jgi:hypothetical protein
MMYSVEYQTYLNSREWKLKRIQKLNSVGHQCEACGETQYLDVHHLTYTRLYRERLSDLQALCRSCHKVGDALRKEKKSPLPSLFTDTKHYRTKTKEEKRKRREGRKARKERKKLRATKNKQAQEKYSVMVNEFRNIVGD